MSPNDTNAACLPLGALRSIEGVSLSEPYCYLSTAQAAWCERHHLGPIVAHLPCWSPQQVVSSAAFGEGAWRDVDAVTAVHGPWVWATEFSNVHTTLSFNEPGFVIGGTRHAGPEEYFQLAKSEGMPDRGAAVASIARNGGPAAASRLAARATEAVTSCAGSS